MSFDWWMDTEMVLAGLLWSNKKERTTDTYNTMNLKYIMLSERSQNPQHYTLHDCIYVTLWKRQNYRNRKPINGCLQKGEQAFQELMELFYVLIMVAVTQEVCLPDLTDLYTKKTEF